MMQLYVGKCLQDIFVLLQVTINCGIDLLNFMNVTELYRKCVNLSLTLFEFNFCKLTPHNRKSKNKIQLSILVFYIYKSLFQGQYFMNFKHFLFLIFTRYFFFYFIIYL